MPDLNVGLVYAYRDPVTYNWIYVGSVHDQRTLNNRHKGHLKGNLAIDRWLKTTKNSVYPEIMQYVGYDHISLLFEKENEWIKRLETLAPNGLNLTLAGGLDRKVIGCIGALSQTNQHRSEAGKIGGPIGGRRYVELYGPPGSVGSHKRAVEGCKKWMKEHPEKVKEDRIKAGKAAAAFYAENPEIAFAIRSKAGLIGGKNGGKKTQELHRGLSQHVRWHVNRNIFNDKCKYCIKGGV